MGKHFFRTPHFRRRCQERQISESLVGMIERNLAHNCDFILHKIFHEEDKIVVTPPYYFIPNPHEPYLIIVRYGKHLITAYWACYIKFLKIQIQETYFHLNLENPNEDSTYYFF